MTLSYFVCSNKDCRAVYGNDPQGPCPKCWSAAAGWSTIQTTVPRRIRLDLLTPAETAIVEAMRAVESAGGSLALTDAVTLLSKARGRVADHVEGVIRQERSSAKPYSIGSDVWNGLSKVVEEAGEVIQVGAKIMGCGGEQVHFDGSDLRERMIEETGGLYAALLFFWTENGISMGEIRTRMEPKLERFQHYDRQHRHIDDGAEETRG